MAWSQLWPSARALLIALVLVVGLVDGCPLPNNKRTPPSMLPTVKKLRAARNKFIDPVRFIRDGFRMHQQWKLFPTASLNQHRLWVEGRTDRKAQWEILYRPLDPLHNFKEDAIEFRRLRGAWNPGRSARRGYAGFVKWVAGEVFDHRPDLNEVRVRLENVRVFPKRGRFESTGKFQYERTRRRERQKERAIPDAVAPVSGEELDP